MMYGNMNNNNDESCSTRDRYDVNKIPETFFKDQTIKTNVTDTIELIEHQHQSNANINVVYQNFVDTIITEMDRKLPVKSIKCVNDINKQSKSRYKPYWCQDLQNAWDNKVKSEKKWLKCNGPSKKVLKAKFCENRKVFDRLLKKAKRMYQKQQQKQLSTMFEEDKTMFWRKLGKFGMGDNRKQYIPWGVKDFQGNILTEKDLVLDQWKRDFDEIYNDTRMDAGFDEEHLQQVEQELLNVGGIAQDHNADISLLNEPITLAEVKDAVTKAKLRKATGVDDIPAEVLKNDSCIQMLHKLIQWCFDKGIVPDEWNRGIICPIPKSSSNDPYVPTNYRGITLISVPCKIYCSILNKRLSNWLELNNILADEQNGFRRNRGCMDHLYSLQSVINYQKSKKKSAYICYIDAKKAFDSVNRSCLWYKIIRAGVNGKILSAMQSLYDNVQCAIRINGVLSSWFSVNNGVKQGCLLSPTLFAVYVNDLAKMINELNCGIVMGDSEISILLFADDIAFVSDSEIGMQQMLNCLHQWCMKWRLVLNMDKTKVVHYRNSNCQMSEYVFKFGDSIIEYADKYKYLGLWLEQHLDFKYTVSQVAASASRALGGLISKFHQFGGMNYETFTHLYKSLVSPVLNYGAGIWGTSKYQCLNTVQNKACRFYLGVGKYAANNATRGDMGWTLQYHNQCVEVFRLWGRIKSFSDERQCKMIHNFCNVLKSKITWEYKVKKLMSKLDKEVNLEDENITKSWLMAFKNELSTSDQIAWYNDLFNDKNCINGNKLRLYRTHKTRLNPETYVTNPHVTRYERSVMSKLRSGSLPLAVETGRYTKKPLCDRICTLCSSHNIENEIHFVIDCLFYEDLRYTMMNELSKQYPDFKDLPSLAKYCIIMCDVNCIKMICQTICCMYNRRKIHI
jgi:hypothetical protein